MKGEKFMQVVVPNLHVQKSHLCKLLLHGIQNVGAELIIYRVLRLGFEKIWLFFFFLSKVDMRNSFEVS